MSEDSTDDKRQNNNVSTLHYNGVENKAMLPCNTIGGYWLDSVLLVTFIYPAIILIAPCKILLVSWLYNLVSG